MNNRKVWPVGGVLLPANTHNFIPIYIYTHRINNRHLNIIFMKKLGILMFARVITGTGRCMIVCIIIIIILTLPGHNVWGMTSSYHFGAEHKGFLAVYSRKESLPM